MVAAEHQRTVKYMQALAAGVQIISHQWILLSVKEVGIGFFFNIFYCFCYVIFFVFYSITFVALIMFTSSSFKFDFVSTSGYRFCFVISNFYKRGSSFYRSLMWASIIFYHFHFSISHIPPCIGKRC